MVLFNHSTRELTAKIVYYGPGLGGKTTNLRSLYEKLDRATTGRLLSLSTAQDRTIYFDLLPVELGNVKGYTVRFQLCTVPGQVFYNETRKLVLRGVDGIVFVVDSQWSMLSHDLESFQNLRDNLAEAGQSLDDLPVVVQYNKRDLPGVLTVQALQESLGFTSYPFVEGIASEGRGVLETFKLVSKLTFVSLLKRLQKSPGLDAERLGPDWTVRTDPLSSGRATGASAEFLSLATAVHVRPPASAPTVPIPPVVPAPAPVREEATVPFLPPPLPPPPAAPPPTVESPFDTTGSWPASEADEVFGPAPAPEPAPAPVETVFAAAPPAEEAPAEPFAEPVPAEAPPLGPAPEEEGSVVPEPEPPAEPWLEVTAPMASQAAEAPAALEGSAPTGLEDAVTRAGEAAREASPVPVAVEPITEAPIAEEPIAEAVPHVEEEPPAAPAALAPETTEPPAPPAPPPIPSWAEPFAGLVRRLDVLEGRVAGSEARLAVPADEEPLRRVAQALRCEAAEERERIGRELGALSRALEDLRETVAVETSGLREGLSTSVAGTEGIAARLSVLAEALSSEPLRAQAAVDETRRATADEVAGLREALASVRAKAEAEADELRSGMKRLSERLGAAEAAVESRFSEAQTAVARLSLAVAAEAAATRAELMGEAARFASLGDASKEERERAERELREEIRSARAAGLASETALAARLDAVGAELSHLGGEIGDQVAASEEILRGELLALAARGDDQRRLGEELRAGVATLGRRHDEAMREVREEGQALSARLEAANARVLRVVGALRRALEELGEAGGS